MIIAGSGMVTACNRCPSTADYKGELGSTIPEIRKAGAAIRFTSGFFCPPPTRAAGVARDTGSSHKELTPETEAAPVAAGGGKEPVQQGSLYETFSRQPDLF